MPIEKLNLGRHHASRNNALKTLDVLRGMKLKWLSLEYCQASLRGMRLRGSSICGTGVTDLTPLAGMEPVEFVFTPARIEKGIHVVRNMRRMRAIGTSHLSRTDWAGRWREAGKLPPVEFWKEYDAGDLSR